jgi:hypothetical protein
MGMRESKVFSMDKGIKRVIDGRKPPLKARLELNHTGDELHEAKRREPNLAMKRGFTSSTNSSAGSTVSIRRPQQQ